MDKITQLLACKPSSDWNLSFPFKFDLLNLRSSPIKIKGKSVKGFMSQK